AARAYGRAVYGPFDSVVAPSQAMCRHLEHWGLRHVSCQPLGVDTAVFHPGCASRPWRTRMGWSDRTRLLVFAGRFAPEKHLDVLAAAVDRLGPPYALLAIGAGPAPPRGDRVRCLPFIAAEPGLAVALASADAFVHAGDQETFGLSALEALACGTPVVLRDSEGLADWVDERVGVGVPSGGAGAFAEAVAALFDDRRQPLPQRRLAARQRALAHDWAQVFPQMLARYRRLLHGAAAAGFEPAGTRAAR
ncbi:MAG: glycosyltransferase, partial [Burkholderiaceae bacterium]